MIEIFKNLEKLFTVDNASTAIKVYALILSIVTISKNSKKYLKLYETRHLRKVWGIKDKESVTVICSELDNPEERQNVEPQEFIYNLKYGDIDAYFEVIVTLLRLYPDLKLKILSAGEAEKVRFDMAQTIILIGGPDYNGIVEKVFEDCEPQFNYRSPHTSEKSKINPDEITIYNVKTDNEYFETNDFGDYGYFESIVNPNNPKKRIIIIGGCHTLGVTAAVKAFSLSNSEYGEIPNVVLENSKKVSNKISSKSEFAVLVKAKRVGQSINIPIVKLENVSVKERDTWFQKLINIIKKLKL